ncbi:probable regulator of telomere elongation helicase 1 homolog at N-terminal half [Coccomyxa sp. Obi]|nr:probable regulator of telomere elongation helicase 1 homolog at N-terminal half [Coccomyxa sp. Obi]
MAAADAITPEGGSAQTAVSPAERISCTPPASGAVESSEAEVTPEKPVKQCKLPRIYYATRTHSQIAQVVRELKRAGYTPKMAILASRGHYCVHSGVSKKTNVDEECDKLLEERACRYFNNMPKLLGLQNTSALQVHDIEDLVRVGKDVKACPYFAARKFADEAELVFCPYNYLIDPVIRRSMSIDIHDSVLIFDEAHNIEDISRDAASVDMEHATMVDVQKAFELMCFEAGSREVYGPLADGIGRLAEWLNERANRADVRQQTGSQQRHEGVWAGLQMREELEDAGLGHERVELLWEFYEKARLDEQMKQEPPAPALAEADGAAEAPAGTQGKKKGAGFALGHASRLLTILRLMYGSDVNDYRLALQRWWQSCHPRDKPRRRGRRRGGDEEDEVAGWAMQFCLWSLNPAIAFRSIAAEARSIILTSGTLSPLDSFASELDATFPVRFEAPHVINARMQVWAGSICAGPDNVKISATYEHSQKVEFQDSVGASIAAIAATVPDGLLVFLPSYSMLDRLMERWKATGIWARLEEMKVVVCEPRGTGDAFDAVMAEFYAAIRDGRGAIFFAICRGKVSEGLDFTDKNARAVIVVGIPFPNVKDTKVNLKKKYNDAGQRDRSRSLLTGDQWYSQQAFRALNQAVGRCIRHKLDYGAIILLDRRFRNTANTRHLSRWVRTSINNNEEFGPALQSMKEFFARLEANPPGGAPPKEAEPPTAENAPGQPTLNAVWKHAPSRLRQLPGRPGPPAQPPPAPQHVPAEAMNCAVADPDLALLQPAEQQQLPPTQTRGRGVEGVFGSALEASPAASASPRQHSMDQAQATIDRGPGVTRTAPTLDVWPQTGTSTSSATVAPGQLPALPAHQGSHWLGAQGQQQQHSNPQVYPPSSHIGQNSKRPQGVWQGAQQESGDSPAASVQQPHQEAASAFHSKQPVVQQAPNQAQQTPPWQQAPASAAQHLLSRSIHRGRGRPPWQEPAPSPGGPSPTHWNGSHYPQSVSQQPHLHQQQNAIDSPSASGTAPAAQHWPTPHGGLPACNHHHQQQQPWQRHDAYGSPGRAGGTDHQDRVQRHDGHPTAQQQQQVPIAYDSPGECSAAGWAGRNPEAPAWQQQHQRQKQLGHGVCDSFAAHWQAQQRLRGQVHCPETPPSVSGPGDRKGSSYSVMHGRQYGPVMSSFGAPHEQSGPETASSGAPHHPPGPEVATFGLPLQQGGPGAACPGTPHHPPGPEVASSGAPQQRCDPDVSCGRAAAGMPLGGVLDLHHAREWLRADVAESVAFLQTAQMQGVVCMDAAEAEAKAKEAVLFCFSYAREVLEGGGELIEVLEQWACPPPLGMQAIAAAMSDTARKLEQLPGLDAAQSAVLLTHLRSLHSLQAVKAMQSFYSLTSDHLFSTSSGIIPERTTAEHTAAPQASADMWPQAVPDSSFDASLGLSDEELSEVRSSREFEDMVDQWMADPRNADTYDAWWAAENEHYAAVKSSRANAVSVEDPVMSPKADTLRAPLSPTAANRTRWRSAADCPGAAKAPHTSVTATAPAAAVLAATETATAAVAEHTPKLQTAQRSGGSHRGRGGGSGGRSGQKRGHAVAEQAVTEGTTAGDGRKRCALSKNQAQVLARKGAARAGPCMAAWTQNSDDTDDFMM